MAQFKVASDRCKLGVKGSVVTVAEDGGINVDALVQGEHLVSVVAKNSKDAESKEN